jgi:arsenate reductase (thioredoxin)
MNYIKITMVLLIALSSFASPGQGRKAVKTPAPVKTILFVCEHGAARSTIAAAYFNKIAMEKGLKYNAVFRATNPDTALTQATKKGLMEDGFEIRNLKPVLLNHGDINTATRIITFDCSLPSKDSLSNRVHKWNGIPPISKDYRAARNEILAKILVLIAELGKKRKPEK